MEVVPDEGWNDPLHQLKGAVEYGVVAPVLDDGTGMSDRGPVARENLADIGERQSARDMSKIHRRLTCQRYRRLAARLAGEIGSGNAEHVANRAFDHVPQANGLPIFDAPEGLARCVDFVGQICGGALCIRQPGRQSVRVFRRG